jgi:hypothetical protein
MAPLGWCLSVDIASAAFPKEATLLRDTSVQNRDVQRAFCASLKRFGWKDIFSNLVALPLLLVIHCLQANPDQFAGPRGAPAKLSCGHLPLLVFGKTSSKGNRQTLGKPLHRPSASASSDFVLFGCCLARAGTENY